MGFAQFDINKVTSVLNSTDTDTRTLERKKYFDDIGVNIQNAHTLESAIKISGLDFTVEKRALSYNTPTPQSFGDKTVMVDVPTPIPDNFATVRSDTNAFLGIVGKKYTILQNDEAFNFLDDIIHDVFVLKPQEVMVVILRRVSLLFLLNPCVFLVMTSSLISTF